MNPEQVFAQLKTFASTLSPRQLTMLALVFVAVVGFVVGSAYWVRPTYSLLFSDLDAESASAVVSRLQAENVPYELADGGRSVRVPSNQVDELRLSLASQGMPLSGRIGFEIFDRTAFGTTDFLEQVNYRRALEGELARSIATIDEVATARVHIALSKKSLFASQAEPAKASVVLKLRNNRPPTAETVNGIAALLAASVEQLQPESVVIVDTFGRSLNQPTDEVQALGPGFDRQRQLEEVLTAKVVSLLEPIVGPGHVRVNVAATLDSEAAEQTEERWDPTPVLRSRQTVHDGDSVSVAAGGIAGAQANAPEGSSTQGAVPPPSPTVASRSEETANYEVSRVTRHTVSPQGQLARLSVAVIVDDAQVAGTDEEGQGAVTRQPRSSEDMQRIEELVAAAVGLEPARGDQLTVQNMSFETGPVEEALPEPSWWQRLSPRSGPGSLIIQLLRIVGVIAIGLMLLLMVVRPMARRVMQPSMALVGAGSGAVGVAGGGGVGTAARRTVADLEGEIDAQIEADIEAGLANKLTELRRLPVLTKRVTKSAEQDPDQVAQLVRSWVREEDR